MARTKTHTHKILSITGYGTTPKAAKESATAEALRALDRMDQGPTSFVTCPTNDPAFAVAVMVSPEIAGGWSYTLIRRAPAYGSNTPNTIGIASRADAANMAAQHLIQQAIPYEYARLAAGSEGLAQLIQSLDQWIDHDLPANVFNVAAKLALRTYAGEEILRMRESLQERAIKNTTDARAF